MKVATPRSALKFRFGRDAIWVYPLFAVVPYTALLWFSAVLSGLVTYGTPASPGWSGTGHAVVKVYAHADDPAAAWPPGSGIGGPAAFWSVLLVLVAFTTYGALLGYRWWLRRRDDGADGMATREQIEKALGAGQALSRLPALRPGLADADLDDEELLHEVAVSLGLAQPTNIPLWVTIEESVVIVAPPREGKTSQLILPAILRFPGTVLATSSKVDVLYATAELRKNRGPVWVCDPTDLSGWPNQMRWPLTQGCEEFGTARKRAETLTATTKSDEGTKNGGYFVANAKMLLTCWLHAAALAGRPVADVMTWATTPDDRTAVDLLQQHGKSALANALAGQHNAAEEERSATWRTAEQPLVALYDDNVAAIFAPPDEGNFDIATWLRTGGTLFLIGEDDEGSALAPLNAAFARAVFDTAKRIAARSPHGRLPIPLGVFGDELANVAPLPQIPSLMSVAGSQNIHVEVVLQSYPQAEERWGPLGVRKIFASATVKVLLGGITDEQELKAYSTLSGEFDEDVESVSDDGNNISVSTSLRRRAVLDPGDIRMIPERQGLIIHRRTPVLRTQFIRAHEGPDAAALKEAERKALEQVAHRA